MTEDNKSPHFLTAAGLERLTQELEHLRTKGREDLAERLHRAFEDGQDDDFVDNAELEAARNEQSFLEGRIIELEQILNNYEIIDESKKRRKTVHIGSWVTVKEDGYDEEERYQLVGAAEASPSDGRISNESPLGKALLGAKAGQKVEVKAPNGILIFKVIKIG